MRVLVTGGAGYVGSHAAKALKQHGFQPVIVDNLSVGRRYAARFGQFMAGDLSDPSFLFEFFSTNRIEAVLHFAASAQVAESIENPCKYFRNNVANSINLLERMQDAGINIIVFSSSCAVYGIPRSLPIHEDEPKNPVSPYGESKLFIERALQWFGEARSLKWISLRYFNAAGADPEGELGEDHNPETHLVPLAIDVGLRRRKLLQIFGNDYPTHDGTAIRDYVHVSDLAEAHVLALLHLLEGGESGSLNLGTGRGHSVREVVAAVERVLGCTIRTEEVTRRLGDPAELVADSERANEILGWYPNYSDLETIVRTAVGWRTSPHPEEGYALSTWVGPRSDVGVRPARSLRARPQST